MTTSWNDPTLVTLVQQNIRAGERAFAQWEAALTPEERQRVLPLILDLTRALNSVLSQWQDTHADESYALAIQALCVAYDGAVSGYAWQQALLHDLARAKETHA